MCIIAIKNAGVEMPSEAIIKNMFQRNPDGAGIMWVDKDIKKVRIEKGIMTVKSFLEKSKRFQKDDTVIMHFRIGTSGGNIKANTHPFPISENFEDLKKLKACEDIAVVHNGIIDIVRSRKDVSDTMEFIANRLAYVRAAMPDFYHDENILKWIENEISSKMAILTGEGEIIKIGNFIEKDGMVYSNDSYEERNFVWKPYQYDWSKYGFDDDIDFVETWSKKKSKSKDTKALSAPIEIDENDANRWVQLYRLDDEIFVQDEISGEFYQGDGYALDDGLNVYEIMADDEVEGIESVLYTEDLYPIKDDFLPFLPDDLDLLEQDIFYEIFI